MASIAMQCLQDSYPGRRDETIGDCAI